jgi:hypothetical protein
MRKKNYQWGKVNTNKQPTNQQQQQQEQQQQQQQQQQRTNKQSQHTKIHEEYTKKTAKKSGLKGHQSQTYPSTFQT